MNWDRLREIIEKTKQTHRDIQIESILRDSEGERLNSNERFIRELKDHLSTCINKNDFEWILINPNIINDILGCNCKKHIEDDAGMIKFLTTLYSMYRLEEDFDVNYILTDIIIADITKKD